MALEVARPGRGIPITIADVLVRIAGCGPVAALPDFTTAFAFS